MHPLLFLLLLLQATISVRTVVVAVPVTVTDNRGRHVSDLKEEQFRIYEEGRLQPVTLFHSGDGPVTLGLVVDHSQSMRDNLPRVTAAVGAFSSVTYADDEMFVVGFNERVSRATGSDGRPFTNDVRAMAQAVGSIPARGQTALYDAIVEGLQHLKQGRWDKRTLIVVSDGGDNASTHSYADVRALALESRAVIYSIGLRGTSAEQAPSVLKRLAEDTGGVAYFPQEAADVASLLPRILQELREQYILGFSPDSNAAASSFRSLRVVASAQDGHRLRVRTRTGYVAPEGSK